MTADKSLKADIMDGRVVRGMFERLDHYSELMKVTVGDKWKFTKRMNGTKDKKILGLKRFRIEFTREENKQRAAEAWNVGECKYNCNS